MTPAPPIPPATPEPDRAGAPSAATGSGLDPAFTPTRLQIVAYLSGCAEAGFGAVQDYCGLSKSTLSKSLTLLDELGYVRIRKTADGRYTRTMLALTDAGRDALARHLRSLRRLAEQAARAASDQA